MNPRSYRCYFRALPALLFALACGDDAAKEDSHLPSVSVAEVESVDLKEEIRASGDLNARLHTTIAAEVEGRITEISVDEGGHVEKGAVVLEIDPERRRLELSSGRAQHAQALANYEKERRQTERIRKLRTQD